MSTSLLYPLLVLLCLSPTRIKGREPATLQLYVALNLRIVCSLISLSMVLSCVSMWGSSKLLFVFFAVCFFFFVRFWVVFFCLFFFFAVEFCFVAFADGCLLCFILNCFAHFALQKFFLITWKRLSMWDCWTCWDVWSFVSCCPCFPPGFRIPPSKAFAQGWD